MATSKILWDAAWTSRGTVLTTELNNLAASARTAKGSEIDNSTNLDQYGKLKILVTFGSAPAAGGYLQIHMVTTLDGSDWEDGDASNDPGTHTVVGVIPVKATTSAQKLNSPIFKMEPGKTKFILYDGCSVAFPASGSTVTLYTANDENQ